MNSLNFILRSGQGSFNNTVNILLNEDTCDLKSFVYVSNTVFKMEINFKRSSSAMNVYNEM